MGNEVGVYSRGFNLSCCCSKTGRHLNDSARRHCLSDDIMNNKDEKDEKYYHFGPMLLRETTKTVLFVSPSTSDDIFSQMQKISARNGWQSAVASSEEEAEERFYKLWPALIVICCSKVKKKDFSVEHVTKRLRQAAEEDGTGIFIMLDKMPEEKMLLELTELGATKTFKSTVKNFCDELLWFEKCMLPMQLRLRAATGLFTALEHCENAVEITDTERSVQLVNYAFEALTGSQKNAVLGTVSVDRRRPSVQKEIKESDETKVLFDLNDVSGRNLTELEQNNWRCLTAPGPSSHCFAQYVNIKPTSTALEMHKTFSGFSNHRRSSLGRNNSAVDTPVTEILSLLKDVQKKCEDDEEMQIPIQKAVKILNSTDLYSPLITRFKREDKVASNLFGGLVLNGPIALIQRHRKTSLSEAMLKSSKQSGGMLRRMSPDIVAILKTEDTWHFNVFDLERLTLRKPLTYLGMKIFQRWKVRDFLQCSENCLRAWLEIIESHYHADNTYHNSTHASDVLQASAYYLGKEKISNAIEHSDAVAALLAAVIHDVDHPGRGSSFLINSRHPLALLYNDVSVLENHHAALAFQLTTSDPRLNIFQKLSKSDYQTLRKTMVDLVLATDMTKHFEYLAKFQTAILSSNPDQPAVDSGPDRMDPRRIICRILIKCADVSNPTRPWHICKEWGYRIVEEYFAQTAEERSKSLPLTMEVFNREACNVPLTQCSFIDMFVREMFDGWCTLGDMPELMEQIEANYTRWEEEGKIWPKQRIDEFQKIEKYLSQVQPKEHPADANGSRENQWSRLSFETTTVYGGGTGLISHHFSAPDDEHHNLLGPCTDL